MKELSQVLSDMPQYGADGATQRAPTSHTHPHGSTKSDGTTHHPPIDPPALKVREQPLTDSQITRLRSALRSIVATHHSATRRRWRSLDYSKTGLTGEYIDEPADGVDVVLATDLPGQADDWLRSALRPASEQAIRSQLGRLAIIKPLAKRGDGGVSMLFDEYARLLDGVPEFAMIEAVDEIIKNHDSDWFPSFYLIKKSVDYQRHMIESAYKQVKIRLNAKPVLETPKMAENRHKKQMDELKNRWRKIPKSHWDSDDWDNYIHDVRQVVDALTDAGMIARLPFWQELLEQRKQERAAMA